jgi:hypothetical protein
MGGHGGHGGGRGGGGIRGGFLGTWPFDGALDPEPVDITVVNMIGKSPMGGEWDQDPVADAIAGVARFGATAPAPAPAPPPVKISTVVAALKQAASEKGYTLSDELLSLMIGQLRGAEGAYPGVNSSLGGTNNYGAAQVTQSLQTTKKGIAGWGAFAHKDSDPDKGAYIGWYWIAPSPLEGARHWFQDNWWGPALAKANPTDATSYAAVLYQGGYYGGKTPHGSDGNDPNSPSGQQNVSAYASAISRGVASAAEMAVPPDDPSKVTVNPAQFAQLPARSITEDLFNTAKAGGIGSAWSYLLPATWADMQKSNGVVWFGAAPGATTGVKVKKSWAGAGAGAVAGFLVGGPVGAAIGAVVAGGAGWLLDKGVTPTSAISSVKAKLPGSTASATAKPPDPKAVQSKLNALGMAKPALVVDGQIGPLSITAIKAFQTSKKLPATGQLDAATVKALGV